MQRKHGELVSVAETLADLPGPVQAIRAASPQARHSFTVADQVDRLVSASEADPDLGFMARMMALCSLPRTNPGNRWHCHVNWLPRDQATISSTQTWFYCRYLGAVSACDALT